MKKPSNIKIMRYLNSAILLLGILAGAWIFLFINRNYQGAVNVDKEFLRQQSRNSKEKLNLNDFNEVMSKIAGRQNKPNPPEIKDIFE